MTDAEYEARMAWSNRMLMALASNDRHGVAGGRFRTHCRCGQSFWGTSALARHLKENYINMEQLAATKPN